MQVVDGAQGPQNVTVIGPSLVLDLSWAAHSVWSAPLRSQHPVLLALAEDHAEVGRSLQAFWTDELDCGAELQVLAHVAGAFEENDLDRLLAVLGAARSRLPAELPLRSEAPRDRELILARLRDLQDDGRWRTYCRLLEQLFAPLESWWRSTGTEAVERAVVSARRAIEGGADWTRMVSSGCALLEDHLPDILTRGPQVVLAVCALFGKALYLDLPGCQLIGLGAGLGELGARARTEELARRMRVLADPTRLAILDHLRAGRRSVGDIALDFDLAQPTVSAHVKQLRDAGLISATRRGARLELSVNLEALQAIASELSTLVAD
jgi:DNA-binding transcriptional ArsR family regulator